MLYRLVRIFPKLVLLYRIYDTLGCDIKHPYCTIVIKIQKSTVADRSTQTTYLLPLTECLGGSCYIYPTSSLSTAPHTHSPFKSDLQLMGSEAFFPCVLPELFITKAERHAYRNSHRYFYLRVKTKVSVNRLVAFPP